MPTKTQKKAAAKAKPRAPARDKANRPSPPDRDGDGNPGGSLKGNQTAPAALGTDDAALAAAQVAQDGLATIILEAATTGKGASHPLGLNGTVRHIATGIEVQVNAAELEVLERSHVAFETVVPLANSGEAAGLDGSLPAAEPQSEETPVDETEETVTPPEGETPAA